MNKQIKYCTCTKCGYSLGRTIFALPTETKYDRSCGTCKARFVVVVPPIGSTAKIQLRARPRPSETP